MPGYTTPPPTRISVESAACYESLKLSPITVLCGRNNSGKSFVLRKLLQELGQNASYLGPARYANFNILSPYSPQSDRKTQKWQQLLRHIQNASQNVDNSPLNLQQAIAELSDRKREELFGLANELLGARAGIEYTIPGNSMSQQYVQVDGYNLSYTSSGFRLIVTLLTALLDDDCQFFLVDEPELGISPEVQGILSDWLLESANRRQYLSHISGLVLATHSPIFLDRKNIANNVVVDRVGSEITLRRAESIQDLNSLVFRLLGNRFETLFLPSLILIVEGKTDYAFLSRLLALRAPNSAISIVHAGGDSRVREVVNVARQMLGDLQRSPYARRIFVVLDSRHSPNLIVQLASMGIQREHIIVWDRNGIEYVYPPKLLAAKFGAFSPIVIDGDVVRINGHETNKQALAEYVTNGLTLEHELPDELLEKLVRPVESLLY